MSKRFPKKQEIYYLLMATVFPIHVWSLINVTREVPAWILRLSISDMVGVIAYAQFYALIDTLVIFIPLLLLAVLLPTTLFRNKFVAKGTAVIFISSAWFIFLHLNGQIIEQRQIAVLGIWGVSYLLVLAAAILIIQKNQKLEMAIVSFVQRLSVLSVLYLIIDLLSLIVIVVRNV